MKNKKGFTLVELLVVIAIIALLLSILMPALQKVRKQARMVIDKSNLKQLAYAGQMYTNDNQGKFWIGPYGVDAGTDGALYGGVLYPRPPQVWMVALKPYFKDSKLMCCPEAPYSKPRTNADKTPAFPLPYASWRNTTTDADKWWYGVPGDISSYGENQWITDCAPAAWSVGIGGKWKEWFWKKITRLKNANNVPMLFDSIHPTPKPFPDDVPQDVPEVWSSADAMSGLMTLRHDGQMNVAFADFSIRQTGLKDAWWFQWTTRWPYGEGGTIVPLPASWPDWMSKLRNQHPGN